MKFVKTSISIYFVDHLQSDLQYVIVPLKGQSHEIFCTRFFPQTVPPGSIRDVDFFASWLSYKHFKMTP